MQPGRNADPSPHSSAVVMKGLNYTSTPLWAVRPVQSLSACTRVHFTFLLLVQLQTVSYFVTLLASRICNNAGR